MRRQRGFTLVELVVAMFIAAVMFAIGYGAIRQALTSHDSLKDQQAHLLELQNAVRVMEQDFVQVAPQSGATAGRQ
jgi:general secretion pathway protein J